MKNHTKLHINNDKFKEPVTNIPDNITELVIGDMAEIICVPNNIKYIEFGSQYINKFPDILQILPYGIEILKINCINRNELNLNNLPKSIIKIFIYLDNIKTNILMDVHYPNLKLVNIYDGNIKNKENINNYFINNNIEINYISLKIFNGLVII
jgi:hypothetical protein